MQTGDFQSSFNNLDLAAWGEPFSPGPLAQGPSCLTEGGRLFRNCIIGGRLFGCHYFVTCWLCMYSTQSGPAGLLAHRTAAYSQVSASDLHCRTYKVRFARGSDVCQPEFCSPTLTLTLGHSRPHIEFDGVIGAGFLAFGRLGKFIRVSGPNLGNNKYVATMISGAPLTWIRRIGLSETPARGKQVRIGPV